MSLVDAVKDAIGKRDETDALVNEPVELVVGGAGVTTPKKIALREPSMARFASHVRIILAGVSAAFKELRGEALLKSVIPDLRAGTTPKLPETDEILRARPVIDAFADLIADLVGESRSYVENEMTPRQVGAVLSTYARLVGWENIERFFGQALRRGADAAEKMAAKK